MANKYKTIKELLEGWLDSYEMGHDTKQTVIDEIDELYTDPSKYYLKPLLSNLLTKAVDLGLDHYDLPNLSVDTMDDFFSDYAIKGTNSPDIIQVECTMDMAIPKEDLQNNLQLLLDRHGVLEVSNLIEALANTTPGENKDLHLGQTLIKVRP